jgi:hypothetical protein
MAFSLFLYKFVNSKNSQLNLKQIKYNGLIQQNWSN